MQLAACNLVVSIAVLCNLNLLTEFLNCYVKVEWEYFLFPAKCILDFIFQEF